MFEITRNHEDALEYFKSEQKAYPNGEYDFTFENRYLVYHCEERNEIVYIALDMSTGLSSEVTRGQERYQSDRDFLKLIPRILFAIKYTGDTRYHNRFADDPIAMIDLIFERILPEYGYAVRQEQIKLCKSIFIGLTKKTVAICEAEVGTGKSLAYLVAAVCAKYAHANTYGWNQPVTITTSSIELQNAIINKEIPALSQILLDYNLISKPLTAVLRKGKEHYLCLVRFADYYRTIQETPEKYPRTIELLQQLWDSHQLFDLDRVAGPASLKKNICVKGSCESCKFADKCAYCEFVSKANSERFALDFQVTNHNLYLNSIRNPNVMRSSTFVIVDEAHKLKEAAQDSFGEKISFNMISAYANWAKGRCRKEEDEDTFKEYLKDLTHDARCLFRRLKALSEADEDILDRADGVNLDRECKGKIRSMCATIFALDEMASRKGRNEISAKALIEKLENLLSDGDLITWLEKDDDGELLLCYCPRNIGTELADGVWSKYRSHVLTSGTMSDGKDFNYFKRENGLDRLAKETILEHSSASPFNYADHTRLYIPTDMPYPDNDSKEYIKAVADRVVELIHATYGHTAILFTSYKVLQAVFNLCAGRLENYDVIRMTRSNRNAISEFKKSKNGVLFASGSMWEGVDCIGDTLSSVIIVRLPFPIRSVVLEEKRKESKNTSVFIDDYATPEMLIKLRQGAGRLIRSETDTGVISILDSRANKGRYSERIDLAMAKYPKVNSIKEVQDFIRAVKPEEYFER